MNLRSFFITMLVLCGALPGTAAAITSDDCLFNWAQANYPVYFSAPGQPPSQTWGVYYYRYYSGTNAYLGVAGDTQHAAYIGPASGGQLLDLGAVSGWLNLAGCPVPAAGQNILPVSVDAGPANTINVPFVSVTICVPGTNNCQTIDHVSVDTGSSGLRILSSVLSLPLPQQAAGNGNPLVECTQFADGYSWGPVKTADVRLDGQTLSSLAVQVIGDPAFPTVPRSCSSAGPSEDTVQTFGSNGIIGVSSFQQDCGPACAQAAISGAYYACTGANCQAVAVDLTHQVQNPVGLLAADNNGVIIDLPAVGLAGASTVNGSLILGIGTQANNALGSATVYALDSNTGTLTTSFNGRQYAGSFVDSGSNAFFFPDSAINTCSSGFYCPAATQQFTATIQGVNGRSGTVGFSVANGDSLLSSGNTAFVNLGGQVSAISGFDWGLPFFFGRRVYTAIEGKSTAGGSGPYVAY